MDRVKRTIRTLKKEIDDIEALVNRRMHEPDTETLTDIVLHRLAAQRNTIEWVLRMLEEGDFDNG